MKTRQATVVFVKTPVPGRVKTRLARDIGNDAAYLHQAFSQFDDHDLVIGPAIDGGYCLIGFRQQSYTPALFEGIPWSTDQVLHLTLQPALKGGLNVGLLKVLRDVDTVDALVPYYF